MNESEDILTVKKFLSDAVLVEDVISAGKQILEFGNDSDAYSEIEKCLDDCFKAFESMEAAGDYSSIDDLEEVQAQLFVLQAELAEEREENRE